MQLVQLIVGCCYYRYLLLTNFLHRILLIYKRSDNGIKAKSDDVITNQDVKLLLR